MLFRSFSNKESCSIDDGKRYVITVRASPIDDYPSRKSTPSFLTVVMQNHFPVWDVLIDVIFLHSNRRHFVLRPHYTGVLSFRYTRHSIRDWFVARPISKVSRVEGCRKTRCATPCLIAHTLPVKHFEIIATDSITMRRSSTAQQTMNLKDFGTYGDEINLKAMADPSETLNKQNTGE